jgi:UTP--glucose-1-phosphate uridylyltransferase
MKWSMGYNLMFHKLSVIFSSALFLTQSSQTMSYTMKINKAVIPAAGLGTRFLPYTKAIPKEMLPILEKPSIQLIIEEGLASNISEFYIIANDDKQAIKNHLTHQTKLEQTLEKSGKLALLESINTAIDSAQFSYIPQSEPRGLGHAVLQAKNSIGDEYFGIFLPDEIMIGEIPAIAQLIEVAQKYNSSVIGVQEVPHEKVSSYGIISIKEQLEDGVFDITGLVEKPSIDQAPSNFALAGRYVLSPHIFASLETTTPGAGGEIQLTDGIADMMRKGERVIACVMKTTRYDVGNPLGWLQANIEVGLQNPTYGSIIKDFCKKITSNN